MEIGDTIPISENWVMSLDFRAPDLLYALMFLKR